MQLLLLNRIDVATLCLILQVTPPWIGKALQQLTLERKGRGRERYFSQDEISILRNVKLLRLCGVSWNALKETRRLEQQTSQEIDACYVKRIADIIAGFPPKDVIEMQFGFVLTEPYRFRFASDASQKEWMLPREHFLDLMRNIADKHSLKDVKEMMLGKIQGFQKELSEIGKSASKFYEPTTRRGANVGSGESKRKSVKAAS